MPVEIFWITFDFIRFDDQGAFGFKEQAYLSTDQSRDFALEKKHDACRKYRSEATPVKIKKNFKKIEYKKRSGGLL